MCRKKVVVIHFHHLHVYYELIVGLEVMAESVRAGTHSESCRETVPDSRSCDAETASVHLSVCLSVCFSVCLQ